MSQSIIEVHFKEIMDLAGQIRELSKLLDSLAKEEMMQNICNIKAGWNSECADILVGKEVRIASGLAQEADQLNVIAAEMEDQAKKMYQSEISNIQLAVIRSY